MDALPMAEESGESFACPTGTEAHTCGHDFHTAMLLTAAKILKENESLLSGQVRFMFQPAEETFEGAKNMIANGILDGVDAALAYHVGSGRMPIGLFMYNSGGLSFIRSFRYHESYKIKQRMHMFIFTLLSIKKTLIRALFLNNIQK